MLDSGDQTIVAQANEPDPSYAQFRDQTRFWIQRVAVPLLMVIGLFGNLITMIIMTRRRMRSTTNMYLAALAFVDMLYLVLTFLLGLSHYPNMASNKYYAYWKLRPFLMMLTDACSNTSVWLTVTFTIERYIAVKYPMKGKVWCTEARAKKFIVCVFAFGILFAAPVPFEWKVIEKQVNNLAADELKPQQQPTSDPDDTNSLVAVERVSSSSSSLPPPIQDSGKLSNDQTNGGSSPFLDSGPDNGDASGTKASGSGDKPSILALDYSDFGRNDTYKTIYYWSTAVIFYFIPLFSLMLFNGFLIKSVHQSQRERTKMTNRQSTVQFTNSTPQSRSKINSDLYVNGADSSLTSSYNKTDDISRSLTSEPTSHSPSADKAHPIPVPTPTPIKSTTKYKRTSDIGHGFEVKSENSFQLNNIHEATELNQDHIGDERVSIFNSNDSNNVLSSQSSFENVTIGSSYPSRANVLLNNCDNLHSRSNNDEIRLIMGKASDNTIGVTFNLVPGSDVGTTPRATKLSPPPPPTPSGSAKKSVNSNNCAPHPPTIAPVSHQERRITIMLIAVVILFLVCQIPSAAMLLYTSVHEAHPNTNEHALVLAFGNIFNFLMAVNAAGNFILYSFLSKKYRRTFMILFCSCLGSSFIQNQGNRPINVRFDTPSQTQRDSSTITNQTGGSKAGVMLRRDTLV